MRRASFVLLLLFIFTIPWQTAIGGREIFILFFAFLSTVFACILEKRFLRPPALVFLVGAFVLWQMATLYWSIDTSVTIDRLVSIVPMVALVWMVFEHGVEERERYALLQAFIAGCVVLCGLLLKAYLSGESQDTSRYAPSGFSLNESADMLAAGIAMAMISIGMRRKGVFFWGGLAFVPVAILSVVLTASRSGFLLAALAVSGVFFILWRARAIYRLALFVAVVGVFAGLFFVAATDEAMQASLKRVTFAADTSELRTMTNRTVIWGVGAEVFKEHPLRGVGAGNFNRSVQGTLGVPWSAHNIFVQTAVEGGVVGLALLGALLIAAIGPVVKRRAEGSVLYVILFLVLLGTMSVANFVTLYSLWFGLAIVAVGGIASRNDQVAAVRGRASDENKRKVPLVGTALDRG